MLLKLEKRLTKHKNNQYITEIEELKEKNEKLKNKAKICNKKF